MQTDTAYAMLTLVLWPAFTVKEASTAFTVLILLLLQCNCYAMLTLVRYVSKSLESLKEVSKKFLRSF